MNIVDILIGTTGDRHSARVRAIADLAALSVTLRAAEAAASEPGDADEQRDWERIFHAIHGGEIGRQQERLFHAAGISMPEWTDPDSGYAPDAKAWLDAYHGVVDPLLATIGSWGPADAEMEAIACALGDLVARASRHDVGALAAVHIERARAAVLMMASSS